MTPAMFMVSSGTTGSPVIGPARYGHGRRDLCQAHHHSQVHGSGEDPVAPHHDRAPVIVPQSKRPCSAIHPCEEGSGNPVRRVLAMRS